MFSQANPTPSIFTLPSAFADNLKHKCGTHFSSGPVDVGVVSTYNGKMAYSCEKCVAEKAVVKAQEEADLQAEFARKWAS